MWRVRKPSQGGDAVHGRIENQLRPLGRTSVSQCLRFEPTLYQQVSSFLYDGKRGSPRLEGTKPGCGVQFVLDMRVAVPSAAHECCSANHVSPRVLGQDFFAAHAVLSGNQRAFVKVAACADNRVLHLRCLCSDDAEIKLRQLSRVVCGSKRYLAIMGPRHSQPVPVQCLRMFLSPCEDPHFRYARQVRSVETSDRATSDDADTLHA